MMLAVHDDTREGVISKMWKVSSEYGPVKREGRNGEYPDYVWLHDDEILEVKEIEFPDIPELFTNFPKWDDSRVHNWMNYVPDQYKKTWRHHTLETRLAIYEMAESQASKEEWL